MKNVKQTLANYGYDYIVLDGVNGAQLPQSTTDVKPGQLRFHPAIKPGEIGLFMAHLRAWRLGVRSQRLSISLECDAYATMGWHLNETQFSGYDLVMVHHVEEHGPRRLLRVCRKYIEEEARKNGDGRTVIMPGTATTYKAGAILFNYKNADRVNAALMKDTIRGAPDKWVDQMAARGWLRVGQVFDPCTPRHILSYTPVPTETPLF